MSKILVEIIGNNGVRRRKKCKVEGNTVIIEPAQRGRGNAGWKPSFLPQCITFTQGMWPFRFLKPKLEVKEDATECVPFMKDGNDIPSCTRKTIGKYFEANVIKAAGATAQKLEIPVTLWLIMFVQVAMSFIVLMRLWGKL